MKFRYIKGHNIVALLLLLIFPLLRFASIPFFSYRIFLIHGSLALYFIVLMVRGIIKNNSVNVSLSKIDVLFFIYYIAYFFSYLYSNNKNASFISLLNEVPFVLAYIYFRLVFYRENEAGRQKTVVTQYGITAMLIVAIWGLLQYFFEFDMYGGLRTLFKTHHFPVVASLGNPNFLAEFIVFSMPLLLSYFSFSRKYILMGIFIVICGLTVFFTYSRLAWFGLVLCASCAVIFSRKEYRYKIAIPFVLLFLMSFSFFTYHLQTGSSRSRRVINSLSMSNSSILKERKIIYQAGIDMFCDSSLLGMGPGSFAYNYLEYQGRAVMKLEPGSSRYRLIDLDHAHSDFIEIGVDSGYIGLTLFLLLLGMSIYSGVKNLNRKEEPDAHRFLNIVPIIYVPFAIWAFPLYLPFSKLILFLSMAYIASQKLQSLQSIISWRASPIVASLLLSFLLFFHGEYIVSIVQYNRGLRSFTNDYDVSLEAFRSGIEAFPYNGYNHFSLGALLLNSGELAGIGHLKRSLSYLKMTRTYLYIARGYRDFGDYRNALKWYKLLIKMRPDLKKIKSEYKELLDVESDD